jgi:hypothetical protein
MWECVGCGSYPSPSPLFPVSIPRAVARGGGQGCGLVIALYLPLSHPSLVSGHRSIGPRPGHHHRLGCPCPHHCPPRRCRRIRLQSLFPPPSSRHCSKSVSLLLSPPGLHRPLPRHPGTCSLKSGAICTHRQPCEQWLAAAVVGWVLGRPLIMVLLSTTCR